MFGLGKRRSQIGRFLDERKIKQRELSEWSGVSERTLNRICSGDSKPNERTMTKIVSGLRKRGYDARIDDLLDDD